MATLDLDQFGRTFQNLRLNPPRRKSPNQFIRQYHKKNKLSIDIHVPFSPYSPCSLSPTQSTRSSNNQITNSLNKKFQTIEPPQLRNSLRLKTGESDSKENTISHFERGEQKVKDVYGEPPRRTPKIALRRRQRPFHSIDYSSRNDNTITIDTADSSRNNIYTKRPPTPTRKTQEVSTASTRTDSMTTTTKRYPSPYHQPVVIQGGRKERKEIKEIKEIKEDTPVLKTNDQTGESYATLTSAFHSRENLDWMKSGYLHEDQDQVIKNIVQRHVEDTYRRIDLIKSNFKDKKYKFIFQVEDEH